MQVWLSELFQSKSRQPRKFVEDAITNRIYYLLQPHYIRNLARKTFIRLMEEEQSKKLPFEENNTASNVSL